MAKKRTDRLTENEMSAFRERLREVIGKESETQFAKRANIAKSGLNRILKDGTPGLDLLIAIASAGEVDVGWLATGRGSKRGEVSPRIPASGSALSVDNPTLGLRRRIMSDVRGLYVASGLSVGGDEHAVAAMDLFAALVDQVRDMTDEEEVKHALAQLMHNLGRELQAARSQPGTTKHSAS